MHKAFGEGLREAAIYQPHQHTITFTPQAAEELPLGSRDAGMQRFGNQDPQASADIQRPHG